MRKLFLLCLMAVLALTVTAVSAQDLSSVDPTGQTIVYWHQFTSAQADTMNALVDKFNTTNQYGITVQAIPQGNYNDISELVNAGIISGELPNLVAGYANNASSYYQDNVVVDLNQYLNDPTWGLTADQQADFVSALLGFDTVNGALIAWPHQSSQQMLVYNQDMLASLGFDAPPANWDEFQQIACAAAQSTGPNGEDIQGFPITTDSSVFETMVASNGGSIFDGTAFTFADNDAVTAALTLYHDLYANGCGYIPSERFIEQTEFSQGLNPFFVSSTAGLTFILQAMTDNSATFTWNWTTFPSSTPENRTLQVFAPGIIMMYSTPEAQLASWLFLKFLVEPENAAQWSTGTGYFNPVPSTSEIISEEQFSNAAMYPYFSSAAALQSDPSVTLYNNPSVPLYSAVRGFVSEAIANVTSNGMSVADAVATLQSETDAAAAGS